VSRYAGLTREQLVTLVPELLLCGQLIDRSGMAWCISAFGRETMLQIAIEEWAASSPIYTRRMQRTLGYEGDDVITIFKGLQLDIGAPPQFMDFRYTIHDPWHGEFHLDHCGALMDVEPMGPDYVTGMCHTIEDPTFDATAVATNPKAQVRPIHRPPRVPADRTPHCAWTVTIDDANPDAVAIPELFVNEKSHAATIELDPIDPADEGLSAYDGPLVSDFDFAAFSHSALVRIADEVCLQMVLLDLAFVLALEKRSASAEQVEEIRRKQAVGFAGIAAHRLARALELPATEEAALQLLGLHPILNPIAYTGASTDGTRLVVRADSPAHDDGAWVSLCGPQWPDALRAVVRVLDPHFDVAIERVPGGWAIGVVRNAEAAKEAPEVSVAKLSSGTDFAFESRRSLPILTVG